MRNQAGHTVTNSVLRLVRRALDLGALHVGGELSAAEQKLLLLAAKLPEELPADTARTRRRIQSGEDPLGESLCSLRPLKDRRATGAIYTPKELVSPIIDWTLIHDPMRLVDLACGSGRFAVDAILKKRGVRV